MVMKTLKASRWSNVRRGGVTATFAGISRRGASLSHFSATASAGRLSSCATARGHATATRNTAARAAVARNLVTTRTFVTEPRTLRDVTTRVFVICDL